MSRVTAIISALVICIIVCLSWAVNHYRDNAITYKAQRDKNARTGRRTRRCNITGHQRDVAADVQLHGVVLKLKMMLRDDVAALVVVGFARIKAVCRSVREATTASGAWIMQPPRLADLLNGIISPAERLITMQKQLEGTQRYINEQCR